MGVPGILHGFCLPYKDEKKMNKLWKMDESEIDQCLVL